MDVCLCRPRSIALEHKQVQKDCQNLVFDLTTTDAHSIAFTQYCEHNNYLGKWNRLTAIAFQYGETHFGMERCDGADGG
jgi:hypothetical protein